MTVSESARWRAPVLTGDTVTLRPLVTADVDMRLDLAVVDRARGEAVGELLLEDRAGRDATLRVVLPDAAWSAGGAGAEVVGLLLDHALRTMGLPGVVIDVAEHGEAARDCFVAAGFSPDVEAGDPTGAGTAATVLHRRASRLAPDYPVLTERLLIRPIDPVADVAAMHAYRSREDVCRYVPFSPGTVEEMAERLGEPERTRSVIDAEGQVVNLVVERRDTGEVIGDVVLFWHSAADGHAEVGYVVHPDHEGQGFATEATAAVLDLAFDGLRAHRVTARVDARNTASARVAERVGMRHEATLVDEEWFKGEWTTMQVYAVLDREWRRRNTRDP